MWCENVKNKTHGKKIEFYSKPVNFNSSNEIERIFRVQLCIVWKCSAQSAQQDREQKQNRKLTLTHFGLIRRSSKFFSSACAVFVYFSTFIRRVCGREKKSSENKYRKRKNFKWENKLVSSTITQRKKEEEKYFNLLTDCSRSIHQTKSTDSDTHSSAAQV